MNLSIRNTKNENVLDLEVFEDHETGFIGIFPFIDVSKYSYHLLLLIEKYPDQARFIEDISNLYSVGDWVSNKLKDDDGLIPIQHFDSVTKFIQEFIESTVRKYDLLLNID